MTIPHEAVEAATKALWQHYDGPEDGQIICDSPEDVQEEIDSYRDAAIDALTAALPEIEKQIRDQIKQELVKAIDDLDSSKTDNAYAVMFVTQGLEYAYRIVHRGESA